MTKTTKHFATELRYLGKGTIESHNADGTVIVSIDGMGQGRISADMIFTTKREALEFARTPQQAGWTDVAKLNTVS